jgi:hypothetical protein
LIRFILALYFLKNDYEQRNSLKTIKGKSNLNLHEKTLKIFLDDLNLDGIFSFFKSKLNIIV